MTSTQARCNFLQVSNGTVRQLARCMHRTQPTMLRRPRVQAALRRLACPPAIPT